MRSDGYWVIRTYKAGHVEEKTKYWIPGERPTRSARRQKASIRKIQQNEAQAIKRLARVLNANFDKKDFFVTLTYSTEGYLKMISHIESKGIDSYSMSKEDRLAIMREEAERELENALRRVKRVIPEGSELKYASVTSDLDEKTGEIVRIHHHMVVNAEALGAILQKWTAGGVNYEHLFDEPDYTELAAYMIKQVRHVPDEKKYKRSRNLIVPQPTDKICVSGAELRVPAKCELIYRSEFRPGAPQYIRYIRHRPAKTDPPEEE